MTRWHSFLRSFGDLLFDRRCAACGTSLDPALTDAPAAHRVFCPLCADALAPMEGCRCTRCADLFASARRNHVCGDCLRHPPPFDTVLCDLQYGGPLAQAIARFKYGPRPTLAAPLSTLLSIQPVSVDVAVPVPLSRSRLISRGFNQAALLAAAAARCRHIPVDAFSLRRREGETQVGKTGAQRRRDLSRVFFVQRRNAFSGRRVLLVDDVVTTGATVRAAATILRREGGAASVTVLCLARTTTGP